MNKDEMRSAIEKVFEDKDNYNEKNIPSGFEEAINKNSYEEAIFFGVLGYLGSMIKGDTVVALAALKMASTQIDKVLKERNEKNIREKKLYCSFCGKREDEVQKLIAGPSVFICNECVHLCLTVLKQPDKA